MIIGINNNKYKTSNGLDKRIKTRLKPVNIKYKNLNLSALYPLINKYMVKNKNPFAYSVTPVPQNNALALQ